MMTAILMSGRTGAAFAANLGTMQVSDEISALQTLGVPPMDFLVVPRIVALSLMMPLLTVFANIVGICENRAPAPTVLFTCGIPGGRCSICTKERLNKGLGHG